MALYVLVYRVIVARCARVRDAAIVLMGCVAVAGCGTSHPRETAFRSYPIKYAGNGVRIMVRERLPGGRYVVIAALQYEFMSRHYSRLGLRFESPTRRRLVRAPGWGSVSSLEPGEHAPAKIDVHQSCEDFHERVLADGVLRNPMGTVTAQGHGTAIVLKKVAIPANLRMDGVLVYALLGRGPTDIVARSPSGRVVSNESYPLRPTACG